MLVRRTCVWCFFFQAEGGIRDLVRSRGLGDVYKRQKDNVAIGVFLLPAQIVSFYRRLAELRLNPQTFSADIIGSESIIADCPDSVNGTFFTEVGITPEFRGLYSNRFGTDLSLIHI